MSPIPWDELLHPATLLRGEFRVVETGVSVAAGDVVAALDARGCRHLFAPIAGAAPIIEDRGSRGVHVLERVLVDSGFQSRFLDAACQDPRWNSVFSVLADEMLAELAHEHSPIRAWRSVLNRWRDLLNKEPSAALTREQQVGLFGELWILEQLLQQNSSALDFWQGPSGGRHDFRQEQRALEVKATMRREGWETEIHGVEQLLAPDDGALWLVLLRLTEDSQGENLPERVEAVRTLADPFALDRLLLGIGYYPSDVHLYAQPRLKIKEMRAFVMNDAFPRIIPTTFASGDVPDRILQLRYTIDLNGLPYIPCEDALTSFLGGKGNL